MIWEPVGQYAKVSIQGHFRDSDGKLTCGLLLDAGDSGIKSGYDDTILVGRTDDFVVTPYCAFIHASNVVCVGRK